MTTFSNFRNMPIAPLTCALLLGAAPAAWATASGPVSGCPQTPCFSISAVPAGQLDERESMLRAPLGNAPAGAAGAGLINLVGELSGTWDGVDCNVVFSYDFSAVAPAIGRLQVLVRSYDADRVPGTPRYRASWDRAAYWLDFDGPGPSVPQLLGAIERTRGYVPATTGDPYPEFATNPAVQAACTAASPCTVNITPYVLLREPGVDYSGYPDLAASADVIFVANAQGQAIAGAVDIYDANNQFVDTKPLTEGDQLQLTTVGYKLTEPGFFYLMQMTDFVALDDTLQIQLENYIPGVDFADPGLPPDLNAGQLRMKLLLDGYAAGGGTPNFALAGPFDLGFDWAGTPGFLFRDGFDAPVVSAAQTTQAANVSLVVERE